MLLWKKYNAFSLILCDGHQKAWICIHNPSRLGIIIQSYNTFHKQASGIPGTSKLPIASTGMLRP